MHHVANENEKDSSDIPCKKESSVIIPAQSDTKPVAWVKASEITGSIGKVSWQQKKLPWASLGSLLSTDLHCQL